MDGTLRGSRGFRFAIGGIVSLGAVCLHGLLPVHAAGTAGTGSGVRLVPHRAIYELKLDDASSSSSVIDVRGRIAYEVRGDACEGYTVNMRIVTDLTYKGGKSIMTDTLMNNWESGDGRQFIFRTSTRTDSASAEITSGSARMHDGRDNGIQVMVRKPRPEEIDLNKPTVFPSAHLRLLIAKARRGEVLLSTGLFDGSEDGKTVFETSAIIGKPVDTSKTASDTPEKKKLSGHKAWPITLSYFKQGSGSSTSEGLPDYEVSFHLYDNGVSTNLKFDYGDFSMRGRLTKFEMFEAGECTP